MWLGSFLFSDYVSQFFRLGVDPSFGFGDRVTCAPGATFWKLFSACLLTSLRTATSHSFTERFGRRMGASTTRVFFGSSFWDFFYRLVPSFRLFSFFFTERHPRSRVTACGSRAGLGGPLPKPPPAPRLLFPPIVLAPPMGGS